MSFRCEKCNEVAQRPNRVVIERKMVNHLGGEIPKGPRGGRGQQIVREMVVCDVCRASTAEAPLEHADLQEQPTQSETIAEVA